MAPSADRWELSASLTHIRNSPVYKVLSLEDTPRAALLNGVGMLLLLAVVWVELPLLELAAYAFCTVALWNVAGPNLRGVLPDWLPAEVLLPADGETVRRFAHDAAARFVAASREVNRVLAFEDMETSILVVAVVFMLAPFGSMATPATALLLWVLAVALCSVDRLARSTVDEAVTSKVQPVLHQAAVNVNKAAATARTKLHEVPAAAKGGAGAVLLVFAFSLGLLLFTSRLAAAALLLEALARSVTLEGTEPSASAPASSPSAAASSAGASPHDADPFHGSSSSSSSSSDSDAFKED